MIGPTEISAWLDQDGLPCTDLQDDNAEWHLVTSLPPPGQSIEIVCLKKRSHAVLVGRQSLLSDEHRKRVADLSDEAYRRFRFDVVHDLLLSGRVQFGLDMDDAKKDMRGFNVLKRLWRDGLTQKEFSHAIQDVNDMSVVVVARIQLVTGAMP